MEADGHGILKPGSERGKGARKGWGKENSTDQGTTPTCGKLEASLVQG